MVDQKVTALNAVDDYLSSLLFDTQVTPQQDETEEPILRFAKVDHGYELVCLWQTPSNAAQQACADLTLLSCVQKLTPSKLRNVMLQSISFARG